MATQKTLLDISPNGCPKRVGVFHNHGFTQTLGNVAIEIVLDPLRLQPVTVSVEPSKKRGPKVAVGR